MAGIKLIKLEYRDCNIRNLVSQSSVHLVG